MKLKVWCDTGDPKCFKSEVLDLSDEVMGGLTGEDLEAYCAEIAAEWASWFLDIGHKIVEPPCASHRESDK